MVRRNKVVTEGYFDDELGEWHGPRDADGDIMDPVEFIWSLQYYTGIRGSEDAEERLVATDTAIKRYLDKNYPEE